MKHNICNNCSQIEADERGRPQCSMNYWRMGIPDRQYYNSRENIITRYLTGEAEWLPWWKEVIVRPYLCIGKHGDIYPGGRR